MGFASSSLLCVFLRAFLISILLFAAIGQASPNYQDCFTNFNNAQGDRNNHTYDGNTSIFYPGLVYPHRKPSQEERRFLISADGCRMLCGSGVQYYPWSQITATITTWVLPVIGILLQAPYESNEFRKTLWALVRWIGSPIASLSYILWNIRVTGKCAFLFDMSTSRDMDFAEPREQEAAEDARDVQKVRDVRDMRDSLYILSVMNQYITKSPIDPEKAITILRVALFADITTPNLDLKARRRKLAMTLREGRKRGVVPVFFTLMWFLFSLAITIEGDFATLGNNATAHDLAIGLLLAWLPVLMLSSIVDRNPTQPTPSCIKLNELLTEVQVALRTDRAAQELIQTITGEDPRKFHDDVKAKPNASKFFDEFAGQGRLRWHYGVTYPILTGMELIILECNEESPRNWLQFQGIQKSLVRGPAKKVSLLHFDIREFWEILGAFLIVIGTISGAFVLSFRTPTIGLGCRTGGYIVFSTIAAGIFLLELLAWYFIVAPTKKTPNTVEGQPAGKGLKQRENLKAALDWILGFCELANTAWLIYIVMAQSLGSYQTCDCQASGWGHLGGYINTKAAVVAEASTVETWWITGVLLSSLDMLTAFLYLVIQWCEQSHLNSVDVVKAMHGLRRTRRFKHRTLWIRRTPDYFIDLIKWLWRTVSDSLWNKKNKKEKGRESIRWSYD